MEPALGTDVPSTTRPIGVYIPLGRIRMFPWIRIVGRGALHPSTIESLQQDQTSQEGIKTDAAAQDLPPHVKLIEMGTAFWISKVVYAAAKLSLADRLDTPKSAAELAPLAGAH